MYSSLNKLKKIALLAIVCSIPLINSCATMISGTSQVINVEAIDAKTHQVIPGATCTLTSSKNVAYPVAGNPGSVNVTREYGGVQTTCSANGYHQTGVGTGNSFNAWTLVDILFWPSVIVDAATGATIKYPSHIVVLMDKK